MNEPLLSMLKEDAEQAFLRLTNNIHSIVECHRQPPVFSFDWNPLDQFDAAVKISQPTEFTVIVYEGLIKKIYQTINDNQAALISVIQGQNEIAKPYEQEQVLTEIYDISVHFVLLHEIYHVLGGHIDYKAAHQPHSEYSESQIGFATSDETTFKSNYFLELEADSNAIISLIEAINIESLLGRCAQLSDTDTGASALHWLQDGAPRELGFRTLLAGVWVVIVLLEASLKRSPAHPMPSARLLSAMSTVMAWFCNMTHVRIDKKGQLLQSAEHLDNLLLDRFLFHVAKPIIVGLWNFPDSDTSQRMGFNDSSDNAGPWLNDLKALILQRPVGDAGAQLESIEKLRAAIYPKLQPYRYFMPSLP